MVRNKRKHSVSGSPLEEKLVSRSSLYSNVPQSSDLRSVEQLWDMLEREIHFMDEQPTNLQ